MEFKRVKVVKLPTIKNSWSNEEVLNLFGKAQAEGIIKPIVIADIFDNWIKENIK